MTERQKQFRRNENLEGLLQEINGLLAPVEENINRKFDAPTYPLVLLVGCARSGSTVMMQWLASTGEFAYPTNLLSRFYSAPYVGARIQQMLADPRFRFRNEFSDFGSPISFDSELGKTTGVLAPNEFFYFWRRFFQYGEIQYLDDNALEQVDIPRFKAELAALESVFEKPLAMKGLLVNWNIPFIHNILPGAIFVYIKRNPVFNAQSLIQSREKFMGDRSHWYSFKPVEYPMLERLDPYQQVAGQVFFTNRAIEQGLRTVKNENKMEVLYEDFCTSPETLYQQLRQKLILYGFEITPEYTGPKSFNSTNQVRLTSEHFSLISQAYDSFSRAEK